MSEAARDGGRGLRLLSTDRTAPSSETLERLEAIARFDWVGAPVVALGDVHWKPQMETPSSTATATRDAIVMGLSSSAQNCGMQVLATPLHGEEAADRRFLARLMTALRDEIPRSRSAPILTREEALAFAAGGAPATAARYGLDPALLEGMEEEGSLFGHEGVDRGELLDAIDERALDRGRYSFAFIGGGNHFLEVQRVEEILEPGACRELGLFPGRIVVMFHTGSERFGGDLGRLYSVRLKTPASRRRKYFFRKIPIHFARNGATPRAIARRARYYFSRRPYVPVPADSSEGRRLAMTLKAAGNYGYANRIAVLELILRALGKVSGIDAGGCRLLADRSHNVIARERIGGEDLWVHRHNSVRLRPPSDFPEGSFARRHGQLSMLPGTNRSSSYLILSREGASATLNSADHGAGRTVDLFEQRGWCRARPGRETLKFRYNTAQAEEVVHVTDEGIDEVVELLRRHDVAIPAVRLTPLAVLKA